MLALDDELLAFNTSSLASLLKSLDSGQPIAASPCLGSMEESHPIDLIGQMAEAQPTRRHDALHLDNLGLGFYAAIAKVITAIASELDDLEREVMLIAMANNLGVYSRFVGGEQGFASL
jgi:hypothetical protein